MLFNDNYGRKSDPGEPIARAASAVRGGERRGVPVGVAAGIRGRVQIGGPVSAAKGGGRVVVGEGEVGADERAKWTFSDIRRGGGGGPKAEG
ncbi:MAG TPA: hypothetical protein P5049_03710 [Methanothrix sp.]|nr:hypothetical protein [Methanothrix sp.]